MTATAKRRPAAVGGGGLVAVWTMVVAVGVVLAGAGAGLDIMGGVTDRTRWLGPVSSRRDAGPTDPRELETFLDGLIARQLSEQRVPGAAVAIVKDGRVLVAKGYGYAHLDRRVPVSAATTSFRAGSVTKLLTWTAVMQLVEAGRLQLDADVNTYLDGFGIPPTYPEPITLRHLLTHTAGFEDRWTRLFVRTPREIVPLAEYVATSRPARIRAPGEICSYSNYGSVLAGYVVGKVSSLGYERYVEERILRPLGMRDSTFRQPPPADVAATVAVGYSDVGGAYRAEPFEYVQAIPAGALTTTAMDMARFMIAHLQQGTFEGVRILDTASASEMQRRQFAHHRRLPGVTYGFAELTRNRERILWHVGGTEWFRTMLALLPERQVGIYVSYNSPGGDAARYDLLTAFVDRYFPGKPERMAPSRPATPGSAAEVRQRAERFEGAYRPTQLAKSTIEKLAAIHQIRVTANGDGTLTATGLSAKPTRWVEVERLVFQETDGEDYLAFKESRAGRITYMAWSRVPVLAFEKVAWHETLTFHVGLLVGCAAVFLLACGVWPSHALMQRFRATSPTESALERWTTRLVTTTSALNLIFLLGIYHLVFLNARESLLYGPSPLLVAMLVVPLVTTVGTVGLLVICVLTWKKRYWVAAARVGYSLFTLTALAFLWLLWYWNLLGFWF